MHQHYSELDSKGIAQASEQTLMDICLDHDTYEVCMTIFVTSYHTN